MLQAVLFLGKYAVFFYLLLTLAGLYAFRRLWKSWKEWREAYFGLEREITMRRLAQWLIAAVLVLTLMCGIFIVATFVVPTIPASSLLSTPTLDLLATPAAGIPSDSALVPMMPVVAAPVAGSQGCVPGQLEITSPKPGAECAASQEHRRADPAGPRRWNARHMHTQRLRLSVAQPHETQEHGGTNEQTGKFEDHQLVRPILKPLASHLPLPSH